MPLLLFLGAGSVIHAVSNEQDMRKMGGLKKLIPRTCTLMFIGTYAIAGFPGHAYSPEDKPNFTALIKQLRKK